MTTHPWRILPFVLVLVGCAHQSELASEWHFTEKTHAVVTPSAAGWSLHVTPSRETIVISPSGREYNVGETQYPDFVRTTLWVVRVDALRARFLVLYVPPMASGAVPMTVFLLRDGDIPVRVADILHHYEWPSSTESDYVQQELFVDSDGDGVPELRDCDVWKEGGTVTYYHFDGSVFHPLWVERYNPDLDDDYKIKLVSRTHVTTEGNGPTMRSSELRSADAVRSRSP